MAGEAVETANKVGRYFESPGWLDHGLLKSWDDRKPSRAKQIRGGNRPDRCVGAYIYYCLSLKKPLNQEVSTKNIQNVSSRFQPIFEGEMARKIGDQLWLVLKEKSDRQSSKWWKIDTCIYLENLSWDKLSPNLTDWSEVIWQHQKAGTSFFY